jgi:hypothetical protein
VLGLALVIFLATFLSGALICVIVTRLARDERGRAFKALSPGMLPPMVHSDNRLTCAIAVALFATGIALSILLIAAYGRPFAGDVAIGPDLLQQVMASEVQ